MGFRSCFFDRFSTNVVPKSKISDQNRESFLLPKIFQKHFLDFRKFFKILGRVFPPAVDLPGVSSISSSPKIGDDQKSPARIEVDTTSLKPNQLNVLNLLRQHQPSRSRQRSRSHPREKTGWNSKFKLVSGFEISFLGRFFKKIYAKIFRFRHNFVIFRAGH